MIRVRSYSVAISALINPRNEFKLVRPSSRNVRLTRSKVDRGVAPRVSYSVYPIWLSVLEKLVEEIKSHGKNIAGKYRARLKSDIGFKIKREIGDR